MSCKVEHIIVNVCSCDELSSKGGNEFTLAECEKEIIDCGRELHTHASTISVVQFVVATPTVLCNMGISPDNTSGGGALPPFIDFSFAKKKTQVNNK